MLYAMVDWLLTIATSHQQPLEVDLELESHRSRLLQRIEASLVSAAPEVLCESSCNSTYMP